jgi:rhodanese-related sulfurtransferase
MTGKAKLSTRSLQPLRAGAIACVVAMGCALPTLAFAAADPAAEAAAREFPALSRAQVDALLASPDKVVVLDVRRADEVSTNGGFPAFLNIQVANLERDLAYIPKDRQVLAVSNRAHRAQTAAVLLKAHGFKVAGAAGALDYADQGGKLVGQKPVATAAAPAASAAR